MPNGAVMDLNFHSALLYVHRIAKAARFAGQLLGMTEDDEYWCLCDHVARISSWHGLSKEQREWLHREVAELTGVEPCDHGKKLALMPASRSPTCASALPGYLPHAIARAESASCP